MTVAKGTTLTAAEEGAAILIHYFKQLALSAGRDWTRDNSRDILTAARLLASDEPTEQASTTAIPTYKPSQARTVSLRTNSDDREWIRELAANRGK